MENVYQKIEISQIFFHSEVDTKSLMILVRVRYHNVWVLSNMAFFAAQFWFKRFSKIETSRAGGISKKNCFSDSKGTLSCNMWIREDIVGLTNCSAVYMISFYTK